MNQRTCTIAALSILALTLPQMASAAGEGDAGLCGQTNAFVSGRKTE